MPFDGQGFPPTGHHRSDQRVRSGIVEIFRHFFAARRTSVQGEPSSRVDQPQPLQTLQLLTVARALVSEKKYWARGRYETIGGRRCAVGALCVAAEILGCGSLEEAGRHLGTVALERGYSEVETMNDNSTHAEVLSAFDEAIARATRCLLAQR